MIKEFSELFKAYSKFIGLDENLTNKVIFIILLVGAILTVLRTLYSVLKKVLLFFCNVESIKTCTPFLRQQMFVMQQNFLSPQSIKIYRHPKMKNLAANILHRPKIKYYPFS
jgi:hypothetical protein